MLRMTSVEGVSDYITGVHTVTTQLKRNEEKILRSLTDMFENVVYAIEESNNLTELFIDELVGSLLTHEQRRKLKKKESLEEALQAKVVLEEKKHYMYKRHNMHATEEVMDDMAEES
jgi:C4-type Zn-finger protein